MSRRPNIINPPKYSDESATIREVTLHREAYDKPSPEIVPWEELKRKHRHVGLGFVEKTEIWEKKSSGSDANGGNFNPSAED